MCCQLELSPVSIFTSWLFLFFFTRVNFSVWVWRAHTHWHVPHTSLLEKYPKTSKSGPKLKNKIKYPSLRLESSRSIKIIIILFFPIYTNCVLIKLSSSKKKVPGWKNCLMALKSIKSTSSWIWNVIDYITHPSRGWCVSGSWKRRGNRTNNSV